MFQNKFEYDISLFKEHRIFRYQKKIFDRWLSNAVFVNTLKYCPISTLVSRNLYWKSGNKLCQMERCIHYFIFIMENAMLDVRNDSVVNLQSTLIIGEGWVQPSWIKRHGSSLFHFRNLICLAHGNLITAELNSVWYHHFLNCPLIKQNKKKNTEKWLGFLQRLKSPWIR